MDRQRMLLSLFFIAVSLNLSSQGNSTDSLISAIENAVEDTIKVNNLISISSNLYRQSPSEAIQYGIQARELGERLQFNTGVAYALKNIGLGYYFQGEYPKAIGSWQQALAIFEQENHKLGVANMLNNIGAVYNNVGDDAMALDLYLQSLKVSEEIDDSLRILTAMINIGLIYLKNPRTYDRALDYYLKALPLSEALGDMDAIGTTTVNLGELYFKKGDYETALSYFERSLKAFEKSTSGNISFALTNIGKVYAKRGDYPKAIDYQLRAYEIATRLESKPDMVLNLLGLAETYREKGDIRSALDYFSRAEAIANEIGAIYELGDAYNGLARSYAEIYDYKNAYNNLDQLIRINDTIFSELSQQQINKLRIQYETEAIEQENKLLKSDVELSEARDRNQMLIIYLFILGFVFTIFFLGVLIRSNNLKRKANTQLSKKNALITEQKKEITDSIHYAKRIQNAMLTPNDYIETLLPERFILFKPRDIVSGDFYWLTKKDEKIICAIADCTGHGVPGAFMSMLGISSLNEIISQQGNLTAAKILNELSERVINSLRQHDRPGELLDGMDMTLLVLDQKNNLLEFAGAMNSLIIISHGELTEHKADKMPIGYHLNKKPVPFTNHKIQIQKGDAIYSYTDGYADQFGGDKGKKFMIRKLKDMLMQIHNKPMEEQKSILENSIVQWMSQYKQVDDILVMGIRMLE